MSVYKADYAAAKTMLWPDETVEVTATQRKVGPGGSVATPTTIVATDKRIIIINRVTLGMRRDIESIPYHRITSVRFENGIISSSLFLRIEGYTSANMQGLLPNGKEWGEIDGLKHVDAMALSDFINKKLAELGKSPSQSSSGTYVESEDALEAPDGGHAYTFCTECGAKNSPQSKFCSNCGKKLKE